MSFAISTRLAPVTAALAATLLALPAALAQRAYEDGAALRMSPGLNIKPAPGTPVMGRKAREALDRKLPAAPEGLVWTLYRNIVFLKPEQWSESEKNGSMGGVPATAWAASPEAFSATKPFETGATIQIIRGPRKVRDIDARKMALAYLKPLLDSHPREEVLAFKQGMRGGVQYTVFRFRDAPPGLTPTIIHKLLLADDAKDSLHVLTFESPADNWDANWAKYGSPFVEKARVLPGVPLN